ncbi:MAG: hypothetical protein V1780_03635 [Chloroflexota bacterium]
MSRYLRQLAKSDYVKLALIMALAFYLAFIPHLGYAYPIHVDEWVNLALAKAMLKAGNASFVDPFYGQSVVSPGSYLETGYLVFWGVFQQVSGISWLTIFRYFPGVIFMMTVLSVYILARRQGFGWEAAFFTALIPTTVGILGPAFMVPVALGLLFIPLCLFITFNLRSVWAYLMLFVFVAFLLTIHPPTAVGLVIIMVPYALLNLRGNLKIALGAILILMVPFFVLFPWIFQLVLTTARSLFTPAPLPTWVDIPRVIFTYGTLPVAICLLGAFVLAMRGSRQSYSLALGLLALLLMLVVKYTFNYGPYIMYYRGLMYMMLMMAVVAGAGLMAVRKLPLAEVLQPWLRVPPITRQAGNALCLVLVVLTLVAAIPTRQDIPYYHMIDSQDYAAFAWIKDNVGADYPKAMLDPWKATAFTAITGKLVYSRIHSFPMDTDEAAAAFLSDNASDTAFLRENGISIIYTSLPVRNDDLAEVSPGVYLLGGNKSP